MTPLPIDERHITRLAQTCDLIEEERPQGPFWKLRKAKAYAELGSACDLAGSNVRLARDAAARSLTLSVLGGGARP